MRRLVLFIVHLCALVLIGVLVLRLNAPRPAQPPTENTARPAPTVSPVLPTLPSAQATPTVAPQNTPTATPGPQTGATATPGRQVTPSPGPGGARPDEAAFLEQLRTQAPPQRDLADLARRLKGAMPLATPATNSQTRLVGSKSTFWVTDMQTMAHFTVTATLRHSSAHLYMYVDDAATGITLQALRASADVFESKTYSTTRAYFGSAWAPGLDGDEHITVLHILRLGATGAFSAADEESQAGNPYSNGRHMIYMNVNDVRPGARVYDSVLAHEFQHAIHFFQDRNEDAWVNEGASVLAEKLNGFDVDGAVQQFAAFPDTQLTTWSDEPDRGAHYGAAFAFLYYFWERYGDLALRELIAEPANGADGIDRVLARLGRGERFNNVFADWLVANVLDDTALADGRYGYRGLDIDLEPDVTHRALPANQSESIRQYAARYIQFNPTLAGAWITFHGRQRVPLVNNNAYSGWYQWWSNRGDLMDATLTRRFDLTGLRAATLTFWTWYDIEEDWDYAYLLASVDNGRTWTSLRTQHTTTANPVGNNLGNGYTGRSGGQARATWIQDRADLTPFAGKKILLRFEYVTDDAVNGPGFCIDDIAIAELAFTDDAEGEGAWEASGFVRSSNTIPQGYILRLITFGGNETKVEDIPIDRQGRAEFYVRPGRRAVLAIAATAPITTEPAHYDYEIRVEGEVAAQALSWAAQSARRFHSLAF